VPAGARKRSGGGVPVAREQGRTNGRLCAAIAGRRVIRFTYNGRERIVEPHAHGITVEGVEVLSGYQSAGYSASGPVPGWRTFHVEKMGVVEDAGIGFAGPRPDYNPAKLRIAVLCCRL
jgi:hypothetical protein